MSTTTEVATTSPAKPAPHVSFNGGQLSLDQLMEVSRVMAASSLLPQDLRGKPADVFITIMYGQELAMSPMQAVLGIYVVKGRPSLSGQAWFSLVRRAGHRITVSDHTDQACTVTIERGDTGETHSETYTIQDAVRANLVKIKDGVPFARSKHGEPLPWETRTKRMLMWRAGTSCATVLCPEVALGFEMQGAEPVEQVDATAKLGQVAAHRTDRRMDGVPQTPASAEYLCPICGSRGEHYEDECPNAEVVDPPTAEPFDADGLAETLAEIERENAADDGTGDGPR